MKILLTLFILMLSLSAASFFSTSYDKHELQVVLRYDDYSKYSKLDLEKELFQIARSKGGGILVGVIPYPYEPHANVDNNFDKSVFLNDDKLELLKNYHQDNTVTVAVHGFAHSNNELMNFKSEYAGLPLSTQELYLKIARHKLEEATGFPVTAFVPPFNTLDRNTLTALKNAGFTLLSAASSLSFYQPDDIDYLPGGPYPNRLRSVINAAIANNHYDALIVSTQHPYDIKESGEAIPDFRKNKRQVSLADIKSDLDYIASLEHVRFTSPEKLRSSPGELSAKRLLSDIRLRNSFISKHLLLPAFLGLTPISGLYYTQDASEDMYIKQIVMTISLYLAITLFIMICCKCLMMFFKTIWLPRILTAVAILVIAAISVKIYFSGLYLISAVILAVSLSLGVSSSLQLKKSNMVMER